MDGRKKNKGVKGNKGGRKSKAEELKVSAYATDAIVAEYGSIEDFWRFMAEQSRRSKDHLFKLLEYAYGKPAQQVDVTSDGKAFPTPTIIIPKGE